MKWWVAWCCWAMMTVACGETIIYPRHQAQHDPQLDYMLAVLKLAVEKSGKPYTLQQSKLVMVQSRVIQEIADNSGSVDIVWTMTDVEREKTLLPVLIPIDRGLIGWRIALLQASRADLFANVATRFDLKPFTAGQMHDWPDTRILRDSGLKVDTTSSYEALFQQLSAGRFDYFPRSVIEISDELASHSEMGLTMDRHIVIEYPTAFYFFVSRKHPQLAADLTRGLEAAVADGSLQRLFHQHFDALLRRMRLSERRHIKLENAWLPLSAPLNRPELWYQPEAEGKTP
ncbi:substrate-binding periplasmic protein [Andreprevotia chitinilytica]|uniref:substrate-binding periplasmic protein n=1 Tax=Andreprevotia chitinilytica TaxID=396808 RepID=UPI0005531855|nr:transporter substrate-binding domain-containing protein [Andreprevotia chitinilytica]